MNTCEQYLGDSTGKTLWPIISEMGVEVASKLLSWWLEVQKLYSSRQEVQVVEEQIWE